jgi:transposase
MYMAYSIELSAIEVAELKKLRRSEKSGKILRRYQCIWLAHEGLPKKEIASTLGVNIDTVTDWVKLFNEYRLSGLCKLHYEGRRPSALDPIKDLLLKHIREQSISKLSELQDFLETNHSIVVEHSWLSRYCKKNSIALIKRQG